jgi:DNA repair/transcription protein MET18/MMS19
MHEMHKAAPNFLSQLVEYFVGEKDPRNLMLVFSVLLVIMTEWDISACVQDIFNAVFDYFPITYRPPADDTSGVTAAALKERVQACIASTPALAPFAFPALLDKLDLTSPNTKVGHCV